MTAILDSASNDLLSECHRRSLKKIATLPDSNEEVDDTILTWWSRTEQWNDICRNHVKQISTVWKNPRHTHHTCSCCPSWTKTEMGNVLTASLHIPQQLSFFFFTLHHCFSGQFLTFLLSPNVQVILLYWTTLGRHEAKSVLMFQSLATYFTKMISSISDHTVTKWHAYILFGLCVSCLGGSNLL